MVLEIKRGNRHSNLMPTSDNKALHIRSNREYGKATITTLFGQLISNHKYCLDNNEGQGDIDESGKGIELD